MEPNVVHNQQANRYELWLGDDRVGLADYSRMPGERHFVHTEVNPEHQGKNYAAILMREAFLDMRQNSAENQGRIVPPREHLSRQHRCGSARCVGAGTDTVLARASEGVPA
jgi:predicted GNAT family acetyltransferase